MGSANERRRCNTVLIGWAHTTKWSLIIHGMSCGMCIDNRIEVVRWRYFTRAYDGSVRPLVHSIETCCLWHHWNTETNLFSCELWRHCCNIELSSSQFWGRQATTKLVPCYDNLRCRQWWQSWHHIMKIPITTSDDKCTIIMILGFLHDRPWISPWIKSISNECYFGVYFPRCCATREINTKITLSWAHKQFATRVHTLFYNFNDRTKVHNSYTPLQKSPCNVSYLNKTQFPSPHWPVTWNVATSPRLGYSHWQDGCLYAIADTWFPPLTTWHPPDDAGRCSTSHHCLSTRVNRLETITVNTLALF